MVTNTWFDWPEKKNIVVSCSAATVHTLCPEGSFLDETTDADNPTCTDCHGVGAATCNDATETGHETCLDGYFKSDAGTCTTCGDATDGADTDDQRRPPGGQRGHHGTRSSASRR